ncbi:hypothetical protein RRF57_009069 [Xylaria bambusicola]|uniref:Uncharacterized protein n=1 Tax=Xylaria bambusicola TaxID=326684 RepID=A0AAN7UIZ0_9PEZI
MVIPPVFKFGNATVRGSSGSTSFKDIYDTRQVHDAHHQVDSGAYLLLGCSLPLTRRIALGTPIPFGAAGSRRTFRCGKTLGRIV